MNHAELRNVAFRYIPGTSQELALSTPADHILYYGTRGPGKTLTQLMRFRQRVGLGYGSFWRGIIFDREFKNLGDLVAQSKRIFKGAKFLESASQYKWIWPTGEELLFRHAKKESDYDAVHGHEYPFIGWNELTKFPNLALYDKIMSTNRSSFVPDIHTPIDENGRYLTRDGNPLPPIPLEVFSTCNPSGAGHAAVKRRFINPARPGQFIVIQTEVFDPRKKENVIVTKRQVALFGSYRENSYLSAAYIAELNRLTANNPNLRKAWLMGSWDVTAGGAIDDIWDSDIHVIDPFPVPNGWYIDRAFDWGSSHPFSVGWWAEANGEEVTMPTGEIFAPAAGSLILVAEWYGTEEIGTNKGLKLSAKNIARGILEREEYFAPVGIRTGRVAPGPADNQIYAVTETDTDSIGKKMEDEGVIWERSDKSPGSRINGLQLLRERLEASITGEGPGIYFFRTCTAAIELLPALPRDEKIIDDVDTDAEDHCYDMTRYRVLKANNRTAQNINLTFAF